MGSIAANSIFVICRELKMTFCNLEIVVIQDAPLIVRFCGVAMT